jgi:hypothetical protein
MLTTRPPKQLCIAVSNKPFKTYLFNTSLTLGYKSLPLPRTENFKFIQVDPKLSMYLIITVQKHTRIF